MTKQYTDSHEWIAIKDGIGTVGISHQAQAELGEVVHVELPEVGAKLRAGAEAAVLESTKAATDTYAPLSGRVVAVNDNLQSAPNLVNRSAESEGWLYQVKVDDDAQRDHLMDLSAYQSMML